MRSATHGATAANPEHVETVEIPAIRRQIMAQIAGRASGLELSPIEDLVLPEWVRGIIRAVSYQVRSDYPDGIPPDNPDALKTYLRRAVTLFDDEYALRCFELEPCNERKVS